MQAPPSDVTTLLQEWSQGDTAALGKLIPLVLDDLREIAGRFFRRENDVHTLQPTALVNEVYLKLLDQRKIPQNREQFFGIAAIIMRRLLVDYAKGRQAAKRGSGNANLPLDEAFGVLDLPKDTNLVDLDEALTRLAELDPRQAQIIELRFITGLSHEEVAEVLDISVTTVKREWRTAKLWLFNELKKN